MGRLRGLLFRDGHRAWRKCDAGCRNTLTTLLSRERLSEFSHGVLNRLAALASGMTVATRRDRPSEIKSSQSTTSALSTDLNSHSSQPARKYFAIKTGHLPAFPEKEHPKPLDSPC